MDEEKNTKSFLEWLKHTKESGVKFIDKTQSVSLKSTITFFDEKYPDYKFDLTLKISEKSDE